MGQEHLARRPRAWQTARLAAITVVLISLAGGCTPSAPPLRDRNGDGVITAYCLGDSNTDRLWRPQVTKWCELLAAELPEWTFVNGGFANTGATDASFFSGRMMLTAALQSTPIDVVMIALGTNDMNGPPRAAVDAILALRRQAEEANAEVLVATIPPIFTGNTEKSARIDEANALLAARIPANRIIDFTQGMTREDYAPDGVHMVASGQRKRAAAALRALRRL